MVELDDEMLLDMNSPTKQQSPARKSSGSSNGAGGNLLDALNYQETAPNLDGFFSDANDQVSSGQFKSCIHNQELRVTLTKR